MKKIIILLFPIMISCSGNILHDVASKSNDDDLLYQAQQLLNEQLFDQAVTLITTKMSTSAQATVPAREALASAYGGKCGLIFLDYAEALSAATTGSAMTILKAPFIGSTADPTSCRTALTTMDLIGSFSTRSLNQNFFTAILGMVLMGTAARSHIDTTPTGGDGTNDVNICTTVTDAQIDDLIIGFGYMNQNISAVSAQAIGSGSLGTLTGVTATCQSVGAGSCIITDPAQITPAMRCFFRKLTNTLQYGVGTFDTTGNDALILTACPCT